MDFLRSRAVPALIAALYAPLAAADGCAALDGTYRFKSEGAGSASALDDLALGRERSKLYRLDAPGSKPGGLVPGATLQRAKTTLLATKAALVHSAAGTRLRFMDAEGKTLVEMSIDAPARWSCNGSRLERGSERMAGLGNDIRTEKLEETLERNGAGDLVYRQAVTVIDPPGRRPARTEARFPAVP